jgi:hypothetical protein
MAEVDTTKIAGIIDRPASEWTPETLHRTFLDYGCAVVRNAVPRSTLGEVKGVIETAYSKTTDVHVYDKDILETSAGKLTGFELISSSPLLGAFLERVYQGQQWKQSDVTARRIQGIESDQTWQQPLDLHLDCQFHGPLFTTNFWVPFQDCGVDSPALQLVPLSYLKTRQYSGYTGEPVRDGQKWYFGYFPEGVLDLDTVIKAFGENCFFRPVMHPGDVILASNWIIHGSYRTPSMKKGRTSVEVRFIGEAIDINQPVERTPSLFKKFSGLFGKQLARADS